MLTIVNICSGHCSKSKSRSIRDRHCPFANSTHEHKENMNPNIIYIIVEHGVVWEIKNIPSNVELQVIDKDVDHLPPDKLEVSPIDGDLCSITKFGPYEPTTHPSNAQSPTPSR